MGGAILSGRVGVPPAGFGVPPKRTSRPLQLEKKVRKGRMPLPAGGDAHPTRECVNSPFVAHTVSRAPPNRELLLVHGRARIPPAGATVA
jgi:hypothetical protein